MALPTFGAFMVGSTALTALIYKFAGGTRPAGIAFGSLVVGTAVGLGAVVVKDRLDANRQAREGEMQRWTVCDERECTQFVGFVRRRDGQIGQHHVADRWTPQSRSRYPERLCTMEQRSDGHAYLRGATQDGSVYTAEGLVPRS